MAAVHIANPGVGGVGAASADDRYAGVGSVRSDGTAALRKEAGLIAQVGYSDAPTFSVSFSVAATAAMDILTLFVAANKVLRLRRVVLVNPGSATAAALVDLQLGTATGIGSGGATAAIRPLDLFPRGVGVTGGPDSGAAFTARSGDTTQATGFVGAYDPLATVSVPAAAGAFAPLTIYDASDSRCKPLTVSQNAAATKFLVLRVPAVGAGATGLRGYAEFTVDDA